MCRRECLAGEPCAHIDQCDTTNFGGRDKMGHMFECKCPKCGRYFGFDVDTENYEPWGDWETDAVTCTHCGAEVYIRLRLEVVGAA